MLRKGHILAGIGIFCLFALLPSTVEAGTSYNILIDDLPSWADYASNVMYESTKAWEEANPGLEFYQTKTANNADFRVQWVKEFGVEHVGYALGNRFIEVGLGDSDCFDKWQPYSSDFVANIMKHEIGHILGLGHSSDPDDIMYPVALNKEYGLVEQEITLTEGYGQFIQFCTYKDITSYNYQVSVDDPTYGFDVYVVPSIDSFNDWSNGDSFSHYSGPECFGENFRVFSGTCEGVEEGSGLLIIMSDTLSEPLTKVSIQTIEVPAGAKSTPNLTPSPSPTPTPTPSPIPFPPTSSGIGKLQIDQNQFVISRSQSDIVKVYGELEHVSRGDRIELVFTLPDGTTQGSKIIPSSDGYFEGFLNLNYDYPKGNYEALASYYGKVIGIVHFTVDDKATSNVYTDSYTNANSGSSSNTNQSPTKSVTRAEADEQKRSYENLIDDLTSGVKTAESSLTGLIYNDIEAKKKIEHAWDLVGSSNERLDRVMIIWSAGLFEKEQGDFDEAVRIFKGINVESEQIGVNLGMISDLIDEAKVLEEKYQEQQPKTETKSSEEQVPKEKSQTCFLFWCW